MTIVVYSERRRSNDHNVAGDNNISTTASFEAGQDARQTVAWLALAFAAALLLTLAFRVSDYIHHDTSEIAMWAHSGWAMGFWKHPPFLPWLVRATSTVIPLGIYSLLVLTAAMMTLGGWAVWQIALMARTPFAPWQTGALALLLYAALPFASGMATKFNHNSGLIALWAITTLAFLRVLDRPTISRGVLFGLAAAAAMLTKYYSGLLLVTCVLASCARPGRAMAFYRSPAPYVAVAVFALAMTPHILWLLEHRASPLAYAFNANVPDASNDRRGFKMALSFAVQTPLLVLPMLLAAWLVRRTAANEQAGTPHRFESELLILAIVPYLATVVFTGAFGLRGAIAWATPVFVCLPALLAARMGPLPPAALHRVGASAIAILLVVVAVAQISMRQGVARGTDGISEPRRAIVEDAAALWRTATGRRLAIVGGDPRLSAAAILFLPDQPQAWPAYDPDRAPWVTARAVAEHGMVAFCRLRDEGCLRGAKDVAAAPTVLCIVRDRSHYLGKVGPVREVIVVLVPPAGVQVPAKFACLTAVD